MQAKYYLPVRCECGWEFYRVGGFNPDHMKCVNSHCPHYEVKYQIPTVELELKEVA